MDNNLNTYDMANIFNQYTDEDGFEYFNLANSINIADIDSSLYDEIFLNEVDTWYDLSYRYYGTTRLWWIILVANNIQDAFAEAVSGKKIKILKKEAVSEVLNQINNL